MAYWKAHSLAKPHPDQLDLRKADHVVAKVDLPGVPQGTKGRVLMANGFNWFRYRVLFENRVELNDLDARHLEPTGRTAKRLAKQRAKA
jgi:hypothetical protein